MSAHTLSHARVHIVTDLESGDGSVYIVTDLESGDGSVYIVTDLESGDGSVSIEGGEVEQHLTTLKWEQERTTGEWGHNFLNQTDYGGGTT